MTLTYIWSGMQRSFENLSACGTFSSPGVPAVEPALPPLFADTPTRCDAAAAHGCACATPGADVMRRPYK